MGVYDKLDYQITCSNCGSTEKIIFLDQGAGWGFPEWVTTTKLNQFNALITDGEVTKPVIDAKACKKCSSTDITVELLHL